jgi:hypothetical protein
MTKGQVVTVKMFGGETAKRRVVAIKENVVVICAEEEYQTALRQGREPEGLGFPWSDVLEAVEA